ncbi:AAA family ATPase [Limosilactobacillus fermentum]|uniref:AAA family ATPase n=1 Tax=Limosilactobacillus fermentum TaxID=1613 RepID=UPI001E4EAECE|nr:AAA family ATPase [Limosilactobacillus fermentum]MCD5424108.1 ATP-binding protein [Limosilactobacillus fermentum]
MKYRTFYVNNFRKFTNIEMHIGKKITVISGINGIGKSSLLSLISSSTGTYDKRISGTNFQPEFSDYFQVDEKENYDKYKLFVEFDSQVYHNESSYFLTKRLGFRNDTRTGRGIRVLPRNSKPLQEIIHKEEAIDKESNITIKEANKEASKQLNITDSRRIPLPTIYLSLSRLYPLGETRLEISELNNRANFIQRGYYKQYATMYNDVFPNSIDINNTQASILTKQVTGKKRININPNNSSPTTQSVGQDNLGSIIGAITDFYALKDQLGSDYKGGVLCIDELDASLHPSALLSLFNLLNEETAEDKLNLQVLITTHSLTILNRIISLEKKSPEDYSLIYFKDPDLPRLSQIKSYTALKADMFDDYSFISPKINVYFEDETTERVFKLVNDVLLNKNIIKPDFLNNLNYINIQLGKMQLEKLPKLDTYFKSTLIILDGDAKLKNKSCNNEAINNEAMLTDISAYEKSHTAKNIKYPNIVSLPTFFTPEIFLFNLIKEFVVHYGHYRRFWNSLELIQEFSNYTISRVMELFKISNDTKYPDIHDKKDWFNKAINFVGKSNMLEYYLANSKTDILSSYSDNLSKAINYLNEHNKSRIFY